MFLSDMFLSNPRFIHIWQSQIEIRCYSVQFYIQHFVGYRLLHCDCIEDVITFCYLAAPTPNAPVYMASLKPILTIVTE